MAALATPPWTTRPPAGATFLAVGPFTINVGARRSDPFSSTQEIPCKYDDLVI